jgi:hypothetical protein
MAARTSDVWAELRTGSLGRRQRVGTRAGIQTEPCKGGVEPRRGKSLGWRRECAGAKIGRDWPRQEKEEKTGTFICRWEMAEWPNPTRQL